MLVLEPVELRSDVGALDEHLLVPETLHPESDEVHVVRRELEALGVVRPCFLGTMKPTERVAVVNARHRPLRSELERRPVRAEARLEIATRALHDGVVEMSLGAARHSLPRGIPEREVVAVVVRVVTRGVRLER